MSEAFRLAVTGGRDYKDRARVWWALDAAHSLRAISVLVHGDCRGVDHHSRDWAIDRGVPHEPHPADWNGHGKGAGPRRNQAMVDTGLQGLIAFPGGDGTADMTTRCKLAGVPVWEPYRSR